MMLGSKLLSWMESRLGRPRKKNSRNKKPELSVEIIHKSPTNDSSIESNSIKHSTDTLVTGNMANLSSPESAYFTGDSTDGASPVIPPEADYYSCAAKPTPAIKRCHFAPVAAESLKLRAPDTYYPRSPNTFLPPDPPHPFYLSPKITTPRALSKLCHSGQISARGKDWTPSPRQRNKTRSSPWPPTPKSAANCDIIRIGCRNSPAPVYKWPSPWSSPRQKPVPKKRYEYLPSSPSSSSSSVSLNEVLSQHRAKVVLSDDDDDDDRTLNEMLGKFDESYVYEKETDILSDSDPTDYDYDNANVNVMRGYRDQSRDARNQVSSASGLLRKQSSEIDFIDDGSYVDVPEVAGYLKNTGHCSYHSFGGQELVKVRRKRLTKKKPSKENEKRLHCDGVRSLGGTPLSNRREPAPTKIRLSNISINVLQTAAAFNEVDREADKKYRQLINDAEHIIRAVVNSPRRVPLAIANKRIESIKNSELPLNYDQSRLRGSSKAPTIGQKVQNGTMDCPQSEPLRRKIYKTSSNYYPEKDFRHLELSNPQRRQILLHTIACLKQNLERQSASLKQVYR